MDTITYEIRGKRYKTKHVTLDNLKTATPQEVFDFIVGHLLQQGVRAINRYENRCRYLSTNGEKCAAGCLLKDKEMYDRYGIREGTAWSEQRGCP